MSKFIVKDVTTHEVGMDIFGNLVKYPPRFLWVVHSFENEVPVAWFDSKALVTAKFLSKEEVGCVKRLCESYKRESYSFNRELCQKA